MTSITLTGNLNMISTNGDGPQMLTEAAEFVAALAQMGVVVGVEINLRPVEKAAITIAKPSAFAFEPPFPPANPQTPSLKEAGGRPDLSVSMDAADRRLYDDLSKTRLSWRVTSINQRADMIGALGRSMTLLLGRPVKMADWDSLRPTWAPSASAITKTYTPTGLWSALTDQWNAELT